MRSLSMAVLLFLPLIAACTGSGQPVSTDVQAIFFETKVVPSAGAGQLYNEVVRFRAVGGAALPDRFELVSGSLPPGVSLVADTGLDANGNPDPDGTLTGNARLLGFPRRTGAYGFGIKAISTGALGGTPPPPDGGDPNLSTEEDFVIAVGEGAVNIITPSAAAGTSDPTVPAFPDVVPFVNPADPQAFFSFAFLVAGGSGNNIINAYLPRELELSVFDAGVLAGLETINFDTDETPASGDKFEAAFSDGGWFVLQAGNEKVQVGGFQSPRGVVGDIDTHAGGAGLDPDWFQRTPGQNGPALNSRRVATGNVPGGDTTLGTANPIFFSDYFDPRYEGTWPGFTPPAGQPDLTRRKYPFTAAEYQNAFFMPFNTATDITRLRYNIIVEVIDTRGTIATRSDDVIARKNFVAQIVIPDITIDTVLLAGGQAGVDYTEAINARGGVPPLEFELEWTDGTVDQDATPGDPLTRDILGIELFGSGDGKSARFAGLPRASGTVELTVRAFAQVMSLKQAGATYTSNAPGEGEGTHPVTGKAGAHKTFAVALALPSQPLLTNAALNAGRDGVGYPGDRLIGGGGVARLVPYPVGFVGTYPASQARRNYAWAASYIRDASHGKDAGTVAPGLPNGLTLDGDPFSVTNGDIQGAPTDRGFHPVTFQQRDAYVGDATNPVGTGQVQVSTRALSVSPDNALYMRGNPGAGGTPTGLVQATEQQGQARMVPLFLAVSLYTVDTGESPVRSTCVADNVDILPLILPHGGNDTHNNKAIPSVSGMWASEAGSDREWGRLTYTSWSHWQQEFTWLQDPSPAQRRVFAYANTTTKKWNNGSDTSGGFSKRYQVYRSNGKRGILIVEPDGGYHWRVAEIDNNDPNRGAQFGAEYVAGIGTFTRAFGNNGQSYVKYYYDSLVNSRWDREVLTQGTGSTIEDGTYGSGNGWYRVPQGRTATSIAMSHNGEWCATVMPGATDGKILIWKTTRGAPDGSGDGEADPDPIPAALLGQTHIEGVSGCDPEGNAIANTAAVVTLTGIDQLDLLPDSLKFVDGGLLFLVRNDMTNIYALDLVSGDVETRSVNDRAAPNGQSEDTDAGDTTGFYPPDTDYLRGYIAHPSFSAQYAFTGNKPADGSLGPDMLAFVVGSARESEVSPDDTPAVRDGIEFVGNRNRALCSLSIVLDENGGIDLANSTVTDLTGDSSEVYGDFLTPGRPGEEQDWCVMSDDGKYVAVVRDRETSDFVSGSFTFIVPTFATAQTSSTSWNVTHDVVLATTDSSIDLDTGKSGTQNILFLGTRSVSQGTTSNPSMPDYGSSRTVINSRWRRVNGLFFGKDSKDLVFNYSGDGTYTPNYFGSTNGWGINPETATSTTFEFGTQQSVRVAFRTSSDGAINFSSGSMGNFATNLLAGVSGIGGVGDTSAPFTDTHTTSDLQFWASFKSANGDFLYYVVDGFKGNRNFMVGFNISAADIVSPEGKDRDRFKAFFPHANTIGFEQFDAPNFPYESRFAAVPGGRTFVPTGRDGGGILFVIASDPTGSATNPNNLELFAMDYNRGGDMHVLSAAVTTDANTNHINYLYPSMDANVVAFQINHTAGSSRSSRVDLNTKSILCACTNVHAVLSSNGAATPNTFVVAGEAGYGSSVAFVGDGNDTAGPQAIVFSRTTNTGAGNGSWDDRTLQLALLQENSNLEVLDNTPSTYAVLGAGRTLDDDPNSSN